MIRPIFYRCCGLALSILVSQPLMAQAQSDREQILATVDAFFQALADADRNALLALTLPGSLTVSTTPAGTPGPGLRMQNYSQLLNNLSRGGAALLERYWDPTVLIEGDIAVFWAPYDFHVDGNFSHCGIDSFQLARQDQQWLLSNLSWTVQRQGCAPSPLGAVTP